MHACHAAGAGLFDNGVFDREADDLNGDLLSDIVTVDSASNQVLVFYGNGDGTFQSPMTHDTGAGPSNLVVAPFIFGLAVPDVATANYTANTVSIILGDPNAYPYVFLPNRIDTPVGKGPIALAAADFNGDAIIDLAVVNSLDNSRGTSSEKLRRR